MVAALQIHRNGTLDRRQVFDITWDSLHVEVFNGCHEGVCNGYVWYLEALLHGQPSPGLQQGR